LGLHVGDECEKIYNDDGATSGREVEKRFYAREIRWATELMGQPAQISYLARRE